MQPTTGASSTDPDAPVPAPRAGMFPSAVLAPMIWACAILVAVEVAAECRAWRKGYETLLFGQRTRDAFGKNHTPDARRFGPTDAFPYRSRIVATEKPDSVVRVWIASASHADDARFSPSDIFPSVLEAKLAEFGVDCQVMNVSKKGNAIAGNVRDLVEHGSRWKPDVVVLYQMTMDIIHIADRQAATRNQPVAPPPGASSGGPSGTAVEAMHAGFSNRLIESSTCYELLKTNLTTRLVLETWQADGIGQPGREDFAGSLASFIAETRRIGAVPVLCTFAMSHNRHTSDSLPRDDEIGVMRHTPTLSMAGWFDASEDLNDAIREVAAGEAVPLIDVHGSIDSHTEYFRDLVHFTARGHAAVGEVLARGLLPVIRSVDADRDAEER